MRTIKLIGHVDEHHRLRAEVPADLSPGSVDVILVVKDQQDDPLESSWAAAVAEAWEADWNDPREDIYVLEDGTDSQLLVDN